MWGVIPNEIKSSIFNYKAGTFEEIKHDRADTCEDVCRELCRRYDIAPIVQLLFGLRIQGKKLWLAGCRHLVEGEKYEFRIRFKMPKLAILKERSERAYDYFYYQVRYDVINNAIPEISYKKLKNEILGLCVADMGVEMVENNKTIKYLVKNYEKYIPEQITKRHAFVLSGRIKESLENFRNSTYDAFYVKGIYLQRINEFAPNYLNEEYSGTTPCPKEDGLKQGTCSVKIQVAPFHNDEPGLRIYYAHKNSWQHVAKFADFYTIGIDESMNQVNLEMQNSPVGLPISMNSPREIESFISCLNGYYRLIVTWNMDLCSQLGSPSLKFLSDRKIHGPIGDYSHTKITEKSSAVGTFLIRQCHKNYGIFFIDIVTKEDTKPETFKILYNSTETGDKWGLCDDTEVKYFDDLIDLAKSIPTNGRYFRLPPTSHDRSELLLLGLDPQKLGIKESNLLRNETPRVIRPLNELLLYQLPPRFEGVFSLRNAEWKQPGGKNIKVTLKILKESEELRLKDFFVLTDMWAMMDLSEIVKMHGITTNKPISLVMESIGVGPLDKFLRDHKKDVKLLDLVEMAYTLAKALHYLQENEVVHGRIRCSSLQVIKYDPSTDRQLVIKLGDPGLPCELTDIDVPWIAVEDYKDLSASRKNLKGDIWAYSTTLWEIFSRGPALNIANPKQFFMSGERLPKPAECAMLPGIHDLMMRGWDKDPERRLPPQKIFSPLLAAKTVLSRTYSELENTTLNSSSSSHNGTNGNLTNGTMHSHKSRTTTISDYYNGSMVSAETDHTYITSPNTTQAYIETCGSSIASNQSHDGGSSQVSLINGNSSNGSQSTVAFDDYDGCYSEVPGVLDIDGTKLIFQGEIGRGNYGCVYRGTMESADYEQPVAIKRFRLIDSDAQFKDFQREAKIMKTLKHENIVKILAFRDEPLLIIMEFINHGSLLTYLSIHRPDLKVENLLSFAANIAKGMHYLEKFNIVHRDLAARNILVVNDKCVKIADFGLAQFTDSTGYYLHSTNSRALPIKWYAPEAIEKHRFSHKSDVWSYGVTLYEMFTFGESPNLVQNPDVTADQILQLLNDGKRLERPKFCTQIIYNEMMSICWNIKPNHRPSFSKLLERAEGLIVENGESV